MKVVCQKVDCRVELEIAPTHIFLGPRKLNSYLIDMSRFLLASDMLTPQTWVTEPLPLLLQFISIIREKTAKPKI